jgi:glycosyl transferase family 87
MSTGVAQGVRLSMIESTHVGGDARVTTASAPASDASVRRSVALFALLAASVACLATRYYGYSDAAYFYQDVALWRSSGALYPPGTESGLNLNLPHVAALFWPLSFVTVGTAWVLWQALQIVCACDILRRVMSETRLRPSAETVALLMLCPATIAQLAMAQTGWTLAWLVAMAWYTRIARPGWCGLWLALAIAAKPFLLVLLVWLALRRRWLDAFVCAVVVGLIVTAGVALTGVNAYRVWLARTGNIQWAHWPLNWSLLGAWHRAVPTGVPDALLYSILAIVLALVFERLRHMPLTSPAGWVFALSSSLLLSPLGWGYYVWILLAPLASWLSEERKASDRRIWGSLALFWVPPALFPLISLNTIGLASLSLTATAGLRRRADTQNGYFTLDTD